MLTGLLLTNLNEVIYGNPIDYMYVYSFYGNLTSAPEPQPSLGFRALQVK